MASIAAQTSNRWAAVIVANHGTDLPDLPERFQVCWVDFPPKPQRRDKPLDKDWEIDIFRMDKGTRVLAGLLQARASGHVMFVDEDDLVSNRLAEFVEGHPNASGWFFGRGYVWLDGSSLLYETSKFSGLCGTSHIVRADVLKVPKSLEAAPDTYIKRMLGSHIMIEKILEDDGTPLSPLPFIGTVYRVGHSEASSRIWFTGLNWYWSPRVVYALRYLRRIMSIRYVSVALRQEFFGLKKSERTTSDIVIKFKRCTSQHHRRKSDYGHFHD